VGDSDTCCDCSGDRTVSKKNVPSSTIKRIATRVTNSTTNRRYVPSLNDTHAVRRVGPKASGVQQVMATEL
jgi:hypothetical protein